jgi:type I restriction enzyme S subunit
VKKGWGTRPLASVAEVFADGDWIESKDQSLEGIRLLQTGNVGESVFKDRAEKARYITDATFKRLRCTEVFPGDCLVSRLPDPVGRSCIVPDTGERMITAVDCTIIRFRSGTLLPEFFNYFAGSTAYLASVEGRTTGATRKRISRTALGEVSVPVPPLPEQRRIVAILDEAFEGIAKARANADSSRVNAQQIFEAYTHEVFSSPKPEWQRKGFEDCIDDVTYTTKVQRKAFLDEGRHPIVSQEADFINGYWDDSNDLFRVPRPLVVFGDHTRVFKYIDFDFVLGADGVKVLLPKRELNPKFFFHQLRGLRLKSLGYARHYRILMEQTLLIPPLAEQSKLVEAMDSLDADTVKLRDVYERKIAALDDLKKSLLHHAFVGEL